MREGLEMNKPRKGLWGEQVITSSATDAGRTISWSMGAAASMVKISKKLKFGRKGAEEKKDVELPRFDKKRHGLWGVDTGSVFESEESSEEEVMDYSSEEEGDEDSGEQEEQDGETYTSEGSSVGMSPLLYPYSLTQAAKLTQSPSTEPTGTLSGRPNPFATTLSIPTLRSNLRHVPDSQITATTTTIGVKRTDSKNRKARTKMLRRKMRVVGEEAGVKGMGYEGGQDPEPVVPSAEWLWRKGIL